MYIHNAFLLFSLQTPSYLPSSLLNFPFILASLFLTFMAFVFSCDLLSLPWTICVTMSLEPSVGVCWTH